MRSVDISRIGKMFDDRVETGFQRDLKDDSEIQIRHLVEENRQLSETLTKKAFEYERNEGMLMMYIDTLENNTRLLRAHIRDHENDTILDLNPDSKPCNENITKKYWTVTTLGYNWFPTRLFRTYDCECGIRCEFRNGVSRQTSDAIFWTSDRPGGGPDFPGQVVVRFGIEGNEGVRSWEHVSMSYSEGMDIKVNYLEEKYRDILAFDSIPEKREQMFLLYLSMRCVEWRDNWVRELGTHLNITALGGCLKNAEATVLFPECPAYTRQTWMDSKPCLLKHFKFTLAVENTLIDGYVTEKFYDPLRANTILIYKGAPNVDNYAPGDRSFIDVNNFASIKQLADYILLLDQNDFLYNEHRLWRTRPRRESFKRLFYNSWENIPCRLCEYLANNWQNKS